MAEYRLAANVTVSAYTTVEADSEAEAIKIATDRPVEFSSGPYSRNEFWLIDEADGSARNIEVDKD